MRPPAGAQVRPVWRIHRLLRLSGVQVYSAAGHRRPLPALQSRRGGGTPLAEGGGGGAGVGGGGGEGGGGGGTDAGGGGGRRAREGEGGAWPRTLVAYGRDLAQFARFVHDQGITAWAQVTPPLARRYVASLSRR